MASSKRNGFIHLLRPSPEWWTKTLPHRTQILYLPDISFITQYLDLRPGTKMIEAGTGSGSFSHAIARTLGPTGQLYTFEYHELRSATARQEFKDHGLSNIELAHRDVCKEGFGLTKKVEAIFLDLPAPWDAIPHTVETLKPDRLGRICCFSPCMEQVQRTTIALSEAGFTDIKMFETLVKTYDLQPDTEQPRPTIRDAVKKVLEVKENKRKQQETIDGVKSEPKELLDVEGDEIIAELGREADITELKPETISESDFLRDTPTETPKEGTPSGTATPSGKRKRKDYNSDTKWMARHPTEMRGHTSYLTFAVYLPKPDAGTFKA